MDHLLNGPVIVSCGDQYLLRASVISEGVSGFAAAFYRKTKEKNIYVMLCGYVFSYYLSFSTITILTLP